MSDMTVNYNYVYQPWPTKDGENIYDVSGPDVKHCYPPNRMANQEARIEADRLNKLFNRRVEEKQP